MAKLHANLPQSGFNYVEGRIFRNGELKKVDVKYRGDSYYRWAWDKKSLRFKTGKKNLYQNMRSVNLLAPRSHEQLNNYLSYRLGDMMGLVAPRTELVRLTLNGEDRGVHVLVEQPKELLLRNAGLMPGDLYRGEIIGKDKFKNSKIKSLFEKVGVWDKVAINNHYPEDSVAPLEEFIELVKFGSTDDMQQKLSDILDIPAWGRFSVFESITQSNHQDMTHNWRLYYDPWRAKLVPIVWDSMGWWGPVKGYDTREEILMNLLMKRLFQNGDFLRARNQAFVEFFEQGIDKKFLDLVSESVETMKYEIKTDRYLNAPSLMTL